MTTMIGRVGLAAAVGAVLAAAPAGASAALVNVIAPTALLATGAAAPSSAAETDPCSRAAETVYALESSVVEARAQYWAYLMKQPGFSLRDLTHEPGSEIENPEIRALFEARLRFWYDRPSSARPSLEPLQRLNDVSLKIQLVKDTCR